MTADHSHTGDMPSHTHIIHSHPGGFTGGVWHTGSVGHTGGAGGAGIGPTLKSTPWPITSSSAPPMTIKEMRAAIREYEMGLAHMSVDVRDVGYVSKDKPEGEYVEAGSW